MPATESVYHLFVVRVPKRDEFRAHLEANGVATAVHYPVPLHLQPAFRQLGYSVGDFPVTERLAREIVSLPMHPFLERAQVQHIAGARGGVPATMIKVGLIGYGYWGPNLARNLADADGVRTGGHRGRAPRAARGGGAPSSRRHDAVADAAEPDRARRSSTPS